MRASRPDRLVGPFTSVLVEYLTAIIIGIIAVSLVPLVVAAWKARGAGRA